MLVHAALDIYGLNTVYWLVVPLEKLKSILDYERIKEQQNDNYYTFILK